MSQLYTRSDRASDIVFEIKLRIPEWKVLFAVDGDRDSSSLADFLGMSESDVSTTLEKLRELELVSLSSSNGEAEVAAESAGDDTFVNFGGESEVVAEAAEETLDIPEITFGDTEPATPEAPADDLIIEAEPAVEDAISDRIDESESASADGTSIEFGEDFVEAADSVEDLVAEETTDAAAPSGEEDFDQLIGNLLDDSADSAADDIAAPSISIDESPSIDVAPDTSEEEFDLGSIFEDEVSTTDESLTETLDDLALGGSETAATEPQVDIPAQTETAEAVDAQTILVVDDSVVIRKMVEIALENESFNIMAVGTGKEALTYLDENTPDVIILDIMLSDMNGLDVLKAIKASKQIPVVMLSAKDTPRETSKAKQLGADDFIPKPFKDEELVNKIKELVRA